jgi:hypothetical protein
LGELSSRRKLSERRFIRMTAKFRLGKLVATPGALRATPSQEALLGLVQRHMSGDWGDLDAQDKAENELSLREGFRLLSAYE